jgi:4-diphosphocytidyl-2-C-methyl-D-erythritol kinase
MSSARVRAQAKVNLLLHVLAREASGYHSIETIFQRLDLADDVRVTIGEGRTLDCHGAAIPAAGLGAVEANLAYRAAVAYSDATGWPSGFAIELEKRIPVGAGLGGGSADAGAVLRALDALAPNPLGPRIIEIASALGADVPFMTTESPMALGWGRGERLHPLPVLESRPVLIIVPDFPIPTSAAYAWVSADRGSYEPAATVITPESIATWEGIAALGSNDFESAVARRHPIIAELLDELRAADALLTLMSGSGSTVYGVFADAPDAAAIARSVGLTTIPTRTSDRVCRVEVENRG